MSSLISILSLVAMLSLASCGNYSHDPKVTVRDIQLSDSRLDFATLKSAVFTPHCVSCHSQYNSYNGVKREIDKIVSAVNSNRMPKNAPALSTNLKNLLMSWAEAGAPERAGDAPTDPTPVELAANWTSISENIIAPKCMVCHNPQGQAKFLDLSSRQAFYDARNRVFLDDQKFLNFDSPAESYLITVIQDEFEPMPPPPPFSNFGRLSQEEVNILIQWIELGLP